MTTRDFKLWGKFGARRMKGINFHPKRCGEIAELAFTFKACGMGVCGFQAVWGQRGLRLCGGREEASAAGASEIHQQSGGRSLQCGGAAFSPARSSCLHTRGDRLCGGLHRATKHLVRSAHQGVIEEKAHAVISGWEQVGWEIRKVL